VSIWYVDKPLVEIETLDITNQILERRSNMKEKQLGRVIYDAGL
jgi:hypothetical protein